MVNKYLECLSVEGNYSKARIGCLVAAIFSLAAFIWLIVLTVQIGNVKKGGADNSDNTPKLECMTKGKKKCIFPTPGDASDDKCEWKKGDKKFECATEVNDDKTPKVVGDCLYQCELEVEGYTQKFLYDGKKLESCSKKHEIKISKKQNTMECKTLCDDDKTCKFFYTTDTNYCVTYKSCDEHRTITGRPGTTFQKVENPVPPPAPTTTAPEGCPDGWYHENGEGALCFYFQDAWTTYDDAVKYCKEKDAILAEPKDEETMTTVWTLQQKFQKGKPAWTQFWIGIAPVNQTVPQTDSDYKWNSNNEVITYKPWANVVKPDEPKLIKNHEACVVVTTTYEKPYWETRRCQPNSVFKPMVVCQRKPA